MNPFVSQPGKRLRIFVGEADEWQGQPLYQAVVAQARHQGVRVVAVQRGIEGFGPEHHLSTERFPDIAENLPIIIEIVDTDERIEALLPLLDHMLQRGMLTMMSVEIIVAG